MLTGSCPTGYITDDFDCIDENECVANNGHGPCQDTCTNTEGSFHCSCEGLPGTRLASDQKSCEEIDLCEQNNGGCSHDCHTSYGQVSSITTSNVSFWIQKKHFFSVFLYVSNWNETRH